MSDEAATILSIAGLVSALAGAGTGAYTMLKGGGNVGLPSTPTMSAADRAASGLLKAETMGGSTPAWGVGLTGGATGPLPKSGSGSATPIGSIGKEADDASSAFSGFLQSS